MIPDALLDAFIEGETRLIVVQEYIVGKGPALNNKRGTGWRTVGL